MTLDLSQIGHVVAEKISQSMAFIDVGLYY